MSDKDKGGRPSIWISPTIPVRIPEKYAKALIEIALEWQENEKAFKHHS
jgi:hypothetical protein